ncbi:MAG: SMP-30/gluconolactonase/LRE family protein [Gemmatimonadales bacterium]
MRSTSIVACAAACVVTIGGCRGGEHNVQSAQAGTPPKNPTRRIDNVGFSSPETVLWDSIADVYLISNINGKPGAADNNGFIARLRPDGSVEALKWIAGGQDGVTLHGPKGMVLSADTLFVADVDGVRLFDRKSGKSLGTRPIATKGLNDLAIGSDGTVYATDLEPPPDGSDPSAPPAAIYRVTRTGGTPIVRGNQLQQPDGLLADRDGFIVAPFGAQDLYHIDRSGHKKVLATLPGAKLDGLYVLPNGWAVTSWDKQTVYLVQADGQFLPLVEHVESPAQLGLDRKRMLLLIPSFNANAIVVEPLNEGTN